MKEAKARTNEEDTTRKKVETGLPNEEINNMNPQICIFEKDQFQKCLNGNDVSMCTDFMDSLNQCYKKNKRQRRMVLW